MAHKVMILMAMGLGAMYMLHLLAQDWNTIRQPLPPIVQRLFSTASSGLNQFIVRAKRDIKDAPPGSHQLTTTTITTKAIVNWKRILSGDPLQCLPSLLCQVAAEAMGGLDSSKEGGLGLLLYRYVWANLNDVPSPIRDAFTLGVKLRTQSTTSNNALMSCQETYPFCWYSAKTMLSILSWLQRTTTTTTSP